MRRADPTALASSISGKPQLLIACLKINYHLHYSRLQLVVSPASPAIQSFPLYHQGGLDQYVLAVSGQRQWRNHDCSSDQVPSA